MGFGSKHNCWMVRRGRLSGHAASGRVGARSSHAPQPGPHRSTLRSEAVSFVSCLTPIGVQTRIESDAEEMDEKPTEGFRKLNFLLNQQPSPPALRHPRR